MGAAGRDFHNFNVLYRNHPRYEVVAFTATQIPNIEDRKYPAELAGDTYPDGIRIHPENELESLIQTKEIQEVVFSYSDVSHSYVMDVASRVIAGGADFRLLGARSTMLPSKKPVVSVCAVRTGCGKSSVARTVANLLRDQGLRVGVVRHPMPYGDLSKQVAQRFHSVDDLKAAHCTIEEMEEYEPHLREGHRVYAGIDYEVILRDAEQENDMILWDGGNNDLPFYVPDLEVVVLDPQRAGHELSYYPGEVNFLRAHVLIINKQDTSTGDKVEQVRKNIRTFNPEAVIIDATMPVTVSNPEQIRGKRVLVVEDGPTLTHGGMNFGAGVVAAEKYGAKDLVDPRPFAVGSIKTTFEAYPHIGHLLPAVGYDKDQVNDLAETIRRTPCDLVLIATPVDLGRILTISQPTCRVNYELKEIGSPNLAEVLKDWSRRARTRPRPGAKQ
ncbi:MAG: GTPase [Deltaproteobacteria bacterium]|nr:GTPase [Deltaproteobacteria bacterium]